MDPFVLQSQGVGLRGGVAAAAGGQRTRARLHVSRLPLLLRSLPGEQRLLRWRRHLRRRLLRWMPWRLQRHVRRRVLRSLDQQHRRLEHVWLPILQPKLLSIEISRCPVSGRDGAVSAGWKVALRCSKQRGWHRERRRLAPSVGSADRSSSRSRSLKRVPRRVRASP